MEYLIGILVSIIGLLGFGYFRKYKQNNSLKADISLTKQSERSKVVDEKVKSAQDKVDSISQEMEKPAEESEEFWKNYTKKK